MNINRERERVILASPSYQQLKSIVNGTKVTSKSINLDTTDYGTFTSPAYEIRHFNYLLDIKENNKTYITNNKPFISITLHPKHGKYCYITPDSEFTIDKNQSSTINIWNLHDSYASKLYFDVVPSMRPKFIIEENKYSKNNKLSLKEYIEENYKDIYDEYIKYLG